MNYEEYKFMLDQSLPKDASAKLIETTKVLKESVKVFFDYQDFYCKKHNISEEVFQKVGDTKTQNYAKEIMANDKLQDLSEESFKEIISDRIVDDAINEGFEDIDGFRASLKVLTNNM